MKVVGLIPARGGSKGVPGKNLKELAGKPLLQWTSDTALEADVFDRVVLSTEDEDIAAVARGLNVDVPFRRPPHLALDTSPMLDVVLHAIAALAETGYSADAVALLQPTSPLRTVEQIRAAVGRLDENWDSVCTVTPLPKELCPHYVMRIEPTGGLTHFLAEGAAYTRRQDVPQAYRRDGSVYVTWTSTLLQQRSLYGQRCAPLILDPAETLSIDDWGDWDEAVRRIKARTLHQ